MNLERDFTEIYAAHLAKVQRLCLGYAGGDQELAKEWVQQTFIKVWKHRKSFREKSAIGSWIYRIAINVCLSDLRKPKRHDSIDENRLAEVEPTMDDQDQQEKISKMYRCIDQLSAQNKALILLELEEIPQADIAEMMGLGHGAVRTRLSRIRKALLKCMTNEK